jgi:WD40 repeat protein
MATERPQAGDQTLDGGTAGPPADDLPTVDPDHYTLEDQIGEGGLGRLLRARDRRLRRVVAVKLMRRVSTQLEARFRREAEITARLSHPGVVPIFEAGRWTTGEPFYAMRLISGSSLKERLEGVRSLEERLPLLRSVLAVCETLGYAHSQGVVHRDLKPANIMIGAFGEAVVIDWGLAKALDQPELPTDGEARGDGATTATGSIVGTPAYMPPEQARGDAVDRRADVYALGAVLYEVLAGRPPYSGDSALEVMRTVLERSPSPLDHGDEAPPQELITLVDKSMARDPAARYADAAALADDLRRYLDGQLVAAHRYSAWQRMRRVWRRQRVALLVALAGTLGLLISGAYSLRRIVGERTIAEEARREAERDRARLLLWQAKLWVDRDPTAAVAWLKQYARSPFSDGDEIATVASDAESRHAARARWTDRRKVVLSADGHRLAAVTDDALVSWRLDDTTTQLLGRPQGAVTALALSSNGQGVLAAEGGHLRLWSEGRAQEILTVDETISALVVAGGSIIAGGEHGSVWILDAGGAPRQLGLGDSQINDLVPSNDGATVLVHSKANRMCVVHLPAGTHEELPPVEAHPSDAKHATLSPDGTRVAWGDDEGAVSVRVLATREVRRYLGHKGQVQRVLFSPDGTHLASTAADRSVRLWDLASGKAQVLNGHTNWSQRLAFSPDGRLLASTSLDRTVRLWDLDSGESQRLLGHDGSVNLIAFTADGRDLVVGEAQGELRVWPVHRAAGRALSVPSGLTQFISYGGEGTLIVADDSGTHSFFDDEGHLGKREKISVARSAVGLPEAASEDGRLLGLGGGDGRVVVFDTVTGTRRSLAGHDGAVYEVGFTRDAKKLVTSGADRTIRLWDLADGTHRVIGRHPLPVWHAVFSPDEHLLASAGDDLDLRVWTLDHEGPPAVLRGHTGLVYQIAFSPDGKTVASAGIDTTIRLWSPSGGEARVLRGHRGLVQALVFSPSGEILATGSDDHTVRLWTLASGEARVLPHSAGISHVRFLPGGAWLVTGDAEGTVRVWDVARASLRTIYRGSSAAVIDLAVRSDGRRVAAAMEDGAVRVWSDPTESPSPPTDAASLARIGSVEIIDGEALSAPRMARVGPR